MPRPTEPVVSEAAGRPAGTGHPPRQPSLAGSGPAGRPAPEQATEPASGSRSSRGPHRAAAPGRAAGGAAGSGQPPTTTPGRLRALGRAELTLLARNRTALFTALVIPLALTVMVRSAVDSMDLSGTGLSTGTVLLPGAMGFVLLFAVYQNLVGTYVVRREELVLKRLRSGEPGDAEVLVGAALPSLVIALAQCLLLAAGGAVLLDLAPPEAPELLVLGLLLGMALTALAAAVTSAFTGSSEGAQLTPMPLMTASFVLSGVFVPLELLPGRVADACAFLPFTPIMELLRGGWTGGTGAGEALRALAVATLWILLAGWAIRSRFRWEPRR